MRKHTNNSASRLMLIVCLSVVLLFAQMFKLHIHIQHDDVPAFANHMVDIHVASSVHDTDHDSHQEDFENHHFEDIEISPDSAVKKTNQLNPLVLLFLVISLFMFVPQLRGIRRHYTPTIRSFLYYLLHPPLRAPPR